MSTMEVHSPTVTISPATRMELITTPQMEREEESRMLPCRFFSNGFCHKGNRCRFYHPSPQSMHNIIRVPPLPAGFGGPDNRNRIPNHQANRGNGHNHGQAFQAQQNGYMNMARNFPMQQQQGRTLQQNPYLPPIEQNLNGMRMGAMRLPENNMCLTGGQGQYDCNAGLGLAYTATNINGLQTYEYENGDQSALIHQQAVEATSQTTLFTHIDWSGFLAPGKLPPPITTVPEQGGLSPSIMLRKYGALPGTHSFGDQLSEIGDSSGDEKVQPSLSNEDMPPEGSSCRRLSESGVSEEGDGGEEEMNRKLTAKEELQMKVKQIAQELADEPISPVRSLDSFFHGYENIDFLPAAMLVGARKPRRKLELREDPTSSSASSSGDESRMSDSSRNDDVMEAMKVIETYLPEKMKIIPEVAEVGDGDLVVEVEPKPEEAETEKPTEAEAPTETEV